MPNLKIYVDEASYGALRPELAGRLADIRTLLCERLKVEPSACQLAVLPVLGLPDQPPVNAELLFLPRPERTAALVRATAEGLRGVLAEATGLPAAVRMAALDPETYLALK